MTHLPYNKHPFKIGDVVVIRRLTGIMEPLLPKGPWWRVRSRYWENGEPMIEVSRLEGGFIREVTARRCALVSAVDQLGDVVSPNQTE